MPRDAATMVRKSVAIPPLVRLAETRNVDAEARTFELVFSAGAQVRRYDWWDDREWIEELEISEAAIDLSRLNAGAPVLDSHQRWSLSNVIGVVERAWIEGKEAVAKVRLSAREDVAPIVKDVADKIIRNVSTGYTVSEFKDVGRDEASGLRVMRAMRWQPQEISFVPIGADAQAQARALETSARVPCAIEISQPTAPAVTTTGVRAMAGENAPAAGNNAPQPQSQQPTGEELERARVKSITDLGEAYAKYIDQRDIYDAIRNGHSVEQFKDVVMQKMQSRHTDTSAAHIGMSRREVQQYSIARAVVAVLTSDWSKAGLEREANQAVIKMLGRTPEGFFVPFDAFKRDFNVGTGTEAGNLVGTDLRTDLYVDVLRNALVASRLGIRILAGLTSNLDIPKKSVASSVGMVTEIQALTETNPQTAKVSLSPKRFGGFVEYSKQALIQSAIQLEPMLRDDLLQSGAVLLENQMLNGSGSAPNIRGLRNTSGVGSVVGGTNGAALAWSHIVGLESACANANAEPDRVSGYLINTKTRGSSKTTQKASNLPFIWDNGDTPLNGYRAAVTNNVPSNLTKGTSTTVCSSVIFASDWSMAVLGLFGAPDVTVDPFTLATTGMVRITLNQFADFGVRQAACFAVADDILTP